MPHASAFMTESILWFQVETGSAITWKYPSCVLKGDNSVGEFYSVALTNNAQQADTGTKMIHLGKNTRSKIISKGISAGASQNAYRGLVQVRKFLPGDCLLCLVDTELGQLCRYNRLLKVHAISANATPC